MFKNMAGQRLMVYAYRISTQAPALGDAANLSCRYKLFSVGTGYTATQDLDNQTAVEEEDGFYYFQPSEAETNGDTGVYFPESSTPDVQVIVPAAFFDGHFRTYVAESSSSPIYEYLDGTGGNIRFTSRAEMERLFSFKGVDLHLDDADSEDPNYLSGTDAQVTEANVIDEIMDRVTAKIMEYLAPRYTAADLNSNLRIREIATYWAVHDLSRRRGNEPVYEDEHLQGIDTLERYREGTLHLNAPSAGPRVSVQSYITDNRYHRNPTRVLRSASTNTVSGQKLAWEYPFYWL